MDKALLNNRGWYCTRQGIARNGLKENGKGLVTIPWSLLKQSGTGIRGVRHLISKHHGVEVFLLRKVVDGLKVEGVFDSKRDALIYFDKALIKRGKEPRFIFKKK